MYQAVMDKFGKCQGTHLSLELMPYEQRANGFHSWQIAILESLELQKGPKVSPGCMKTLRSPQG